MAGLGTLGVIAFGSLLAEGLAGRLTWVVDFGSTIDPIYAGMAMVMPDYMTPTTTTWILHGLWVVVTVALLWAGWRSASSPQGEVPAVEYQRERDRERVSTHETQ